MHYIICGFSGVGKSTAEQKAKNVIDFESSGYSHDWEKGVINNNSQMIHNDDDEEGGGE